MTEQQTHHTATSQPQSGGGLAVASLVLGIISMTGPGLLLGIPAIITGAMALKRSAGDRGLALAGLITGIISTVISILFIAFIALMVIIGIASDSNGNTDPQYDMPHYHQMQS